MKVLIIGMGKSGKGAARFLLKKGHDVVGMDQHPFTMEGVRPFFSQEEFDLIVLSPGIPLQTIQTSNKCEVIGEAELAFRYMYNTCIGITGTNGKSSLTLLITHVLNSVGIKARALGNVGKSLSEYLLNPDLEEIVVAELSSFQLETMKKASFEYGVILNITPDHLDRHSSLQAYAQIKCHLGRLVKKELVVCKEVERKFGDFLPREKLKIAGSNFDLQLKKNLECVDTIGYDKVVCAFAICEKFGVSWEAFIHACTTFQKPSHCLEYLGTVKDVRFYNDSKGTNVAATLYAISKVKGSICLIAGGMGKNGSFLEWRKPFSKRVKKVFAIGKSARQIKQDLKGIVMVKCCENLRKAVENAYKEVDKGGTLLFSPGCASFDQFLNYEERGNKFKEYIYELIRLNV